MRIIFSRKGFDSAAGGCPSPIVEGRPLSLPIPSSRPTPTTYGALLGHTPVAELVRDLSRGRLTADRYCHFDPDIEAERRPRIPGWRGALGQVSAAQGHLRKQGVGPGDLFLFWGLFQTVEWSGSWRFCGAREHRIFGWLQIEDVERTGTDPKPTLGRHPWLHEHPHVHGQWSDSNTIYLASQSLSFRPECRGWGVFERGLRLTAAENSLPSTWRVPSWLNPLTDGTGMTYHPPHRWNRSAMCQIAARGQEFVADIGERPDAMKWLTRLFEDA